MILKRLLGFILTASAITATAKASIVFDFNSDSLGTTTTFTNTVDGLNATFSSPADPGGFIVYSSTFSNFVTLTGNVLGDPGPSGQDDLPLFVSFSADLNAIEFDFATADFITPSPLTLDAYLNSQLVGSITETGQFLGGSFPEGEIAFDGSAFNNIVISSLAPDFVIGNINVNTAAPEPGLFAILGLGFAAIVFGSARMRRTRAQAISKNL
jgi:hypothetical protein